MIPAWLAILPRRCAAKAALTLAFAAIFFPSASRPQDQEQVSKHKALKDALGDPLPPGAVLRLGTTRLAHGSTITCLAFSPKTPVLASGSMDGAVSLWDPQTGQLLTGLQRPDKVAVSALAFSTDGKVLATADMAGVIRLWDIAKRIEVGRFNEGLARPRVSGLAFSPDRETLATACDNHTVVLWNLVTGKERAQLRGHKNGVLSVSFSPDGKRLASGSSDQTARVWDLATNEAVMVFSGYKDRIGCVAFSPNGEHLAIAAVTGPVGILDLASRRDVLILTEARSIVAFSPEGKQLAAPGPNFTVCIWELPSGKEVLRLPNHNRQVGHVAFAPDGKTLAAASGSVIELWDARTGRPAVPPRGHVGPVTRVGFSHDGKTILTGTTGPLIGTVSVWKETSVKRPVADKQVPIPFAWAADGDRIAWMQDRYELYVGSITGVKPPQVLVGSTNCTRLALSRQLIGAADRQPAVTLYDAKTGERTRTMDWPGIKPRDPMGVRFCADGSVIACSSKTSVCAWEVETGKLLFESPALLTPTGSIAPPSAHMLSDDARLLAVASMTAGLSVWRTDTGRRLFRSQEPARAIALSPDGTFLVTGLASGQVLLWDLTTRQLICSLAGHETPVLDLCFSPSGRAVASGSSDTTALVWDLGILPGLTPMCPFWELESRAIDNLWGDLGAPNSKVAYRAVVAFATGGPLAVASIRTRLKPQKGPGKEEIRRLITRLDDDDAAIRERATIKLCELGEDAEADLCAVLKTPASPEAHRRLAQILQQLEDSAPAPDRLRARRAICALEWLASVEAKNLLEDLSRGEPASGVTQAAKAALDRWHRR